MDYESRSEAVGICGALKMPVRVHVVGRPQFDLEAFIAFLDAAGTRWRRSAGAKEAEELVEAAGRICYMSFGRAQSNRSNGDYIQNLIAMGHESVLEHVNWSFVISGITRALSHQLVRHRVGFAFSQLSQQYHDESDAEFVMPSEIEDHAQAAAIWKGAVNTAKEAYGKILRLLEESNQISGPVENHREIRRAIRSAARSVLPGCTETTVFTTINARALRHFLTVRGGIAGDREMRELSVELLSAVTKEAPSIFFDFEIAQLADGTRTVRKI
ncbi:MAG TPA: FAD-dependent thymidylate synthase [Terriglobia bacterium]|nr:FAD-dependent thymidylate synthase [Terriglobia bacterium]